MQRQRGRPVPLPTQPTQTAPGCPLEASASMQAQTWAPWRHRSMAAPPAHTPLAALLPAASYLENQIRQYSDVSAKHCTVRSSICDHHTMSRHGGEGLSEMTGSPDARGPSSWEGERREGWGGGTGGHNRNAICTLLRPLDQAIKRGDRLRS